MAHVPLYALPPRHMTTAGVKVKRCHKVRYPTRIDAVRALSSTSRGRQLDEFLGLESRRSETRTYKCPRCKGYHLTSKAEWVEPEPRTYPASVPQPIPASVVKTVVPSGSVLRSIYAKTSRTPLIYDEGRPHQIAN